MFFFVDHVMFMLLSCDCLVIQAVGAEGTSAGGKTEGATLQHSAVYTRHGIAVLQNVEQIRAGTACRPHRLIATSTLEVKLSPSHFSSLDCCLVRIYVLDYCMLKEIQC